jgi:hypothetical protein
MKHPVATMPAVLAACALALSLTPNQVRAQAPSPAAAPVETALPMLVAKFDKSLDTKSAKVGDPVSAKTLKAVKLPDGTEIPKGSKLIAQVTTVQSKKQGNGNSMLTFRFDQAQLNGGATVPIHGQVIAIGPSLAPKEGLGAYSVMSRSSGSTNDVTSNARGFGSTPGADPNAGLGKGGARDEDNIALGSTLEGVALGVHKDADWTTALQGFKCDIRLDSDVLVKVQLK